MPRFVQYLCLFIFFLSCNKDEVETPVSDTPLSNIPKIELKSVAPTTVTQYKDSVLFTVFYQDGNGDIGFSQADSLSLYLTDTRADLTEKFHISPQSPSDTTEVAIQGTLLITLDHTFLLDTAGTTSESTTYKIKLKDRAGNWSNSVETETIIINP